MTTKNSNFTIAIIGRPNVGKSTLFNRLIGRKMAIVHDQPGVTRDRKEGKGSLFGIKFNIIDTAGLEDAKSGTLEHSMKIQTEKALSDSDLGLLLIDGKAGLTPLDSYFAEIYRKSKTKVILVANKCENKNDNISAFEAVKLGFGNPIIISAEHGLGMENLFEAILPYYQEKIKNESLEEEGEEPETTTEENPELTTEEKEALQENKPINLAIFGRPNVGKSTLVNALLKDERMLVGDMPGVTRDAISVDWQWQDKKIKLTDTAGIRRQSKIYSDLEKLSVAGSKRAAFMAQVVILVLDGNAILDKQDLTLAGKVIEEGRCLIIAVNKWDTVSDKKEALEKLNYKLTHSFTQVKEVPTVTISALKGQNLEILMNKVFEVYKKWNTRIKTSLLNEWFKDITSAHPPPLGKNNRRIKLKYITQAKTRPPSFFIFSSNPEGLPDSYLKYIHNNLAQCFKLKGIPLRITVRKGANPYAEDS